MCIKAGMGVLATATINSSIFLNLYLKQEFFDRLLVLKFQAFNVPCVSRNASPGAQPKLRLKIVRSNCLRHKACTGLEIYIRFHFQIISLPLLGTIKLFHKSSSDGVCRKITSPSPSPVNKREFQKMETYLTSLSAKKI